MAASKVVDLSKWWLVFLTIELCSILHAQNALPPLLLYPTNFFFKHSVCRPLIKSTLQCETSKLSPLLWQCWHCKLTASNVACVIIDFCGHELQSCQKDKSKITQLAKLFTTISKLVLLRYSNFILYTVAHKLENLLQDCKCTRLCLMVRPG